MTRLAPSPWPISSRMIASTSSPYVASSVSKPPRSANSMPVSSIASITSATVNSSSVSMSTTTSGVPSSCASKPRSRTCRKGTASSRSAMCPSSGTPSSRGMSRSDSTTLRRPPTRPTVSRSPARVERRMTAHASCPCSAWRAARASSPVGVAGASGMRRRYQRRPVRRPASHSRPARPRPPPGSPPGRRPGRGPEAAARWRWCPCPRPSRSGSRRRACRRWPGRW